MNCNKWWKSHNWGKWQIYAAEQERIKDTGSIVANMFIQTRYCLKCNYAQIKSTKLHL